MQTTETKYIVESLQFNKPTKSSAKQTIFFVPIIVKYIYMYGEKNFVIAKIFCSPLKAFSQNLKNGHPKATTRSAQISNLSGNLLYLLVTMGAMIG